MSPPPLLFSPAGYTVVRPCECLLAHSLRKGAELRVWKDVGTIMAHRGLGATIGYGSRWDTDRQTYRHMHTPVHTHTTHTHTQTHTHIHTYAHTPQTHTHRHTTSIHNCMQSTSTHLIYFFAVTWLILRIPLLHSRKQLDG